MVRREVLDWLDEAGEDLKHAKECIDLSRYNWGCFVAQQSSEKALKACLLSLRKKPPRVHDLTKLYSEIKEKMTLPEDVVENLGELSSYYSLTRYPNAGLTRPSIGISESQAERAVNVAKKIHDGVRNVIKDVESG